MNYISGIINIGIGLFILSVSFNFFSDYFGGTKKKIEVFQSLLSDGVVTLARVDSVYTEVTVRSTTTYSSKYFFEVDGKEFSEDFFFDTPDELLPFVEVYYMPNDPNINDMEIEEKLADAEKSKDSISDLIAGMLALIIGMFFLYYRGILRFKQQPEVEVIQAKTSRQDLYKEF